MTISRVKRTSSRRILNHVLQLIDPSGTHSFTCFSLSMYWLLLFTHSFHFFSFHQTALDGGKKILLTNIHPSVPSAQKIPSASRLRKILCSAFQRALLDRVFYIYYHLYNDEWELKSRHKSGCGLPSFLSCLWSIIASIVSVVYRNPKSHSRESNHRFIQRYRENTVEYR